MDEEYDIIIAGTGLTECILSGLFAKLGKKILVMDRNEYYGAETASMTPLKDLYKRFEKPYETEDKFGRDRDWNVDLIPKFLMANGELTKLLIHTGVTRYIEFKQLEGSYVYKKGGNVFKVPANDKEALATSLMGIFEKRRFKNFLVWAIAMDFDNPKTWNNMDPKKTTMTEVYKKFGLDANTADFTGHAICLHLDDSYLEKPFEDSIRRLQLYYASLSAYGKSPYLYPLYGLGELPQGFARLCAVYGGTFMLNKPVDDIVIEDGKVAGVTSQKETAKTKIVIGDPSYFPDRVQKEGQVIRAICILNHTIAKADSSKSCQIILPANQVGRKSDIYVGLLGAENNVSTKNYSIGFVSTIVETSDPEAELKPGLDLLEPIVDKFVTVKDLYVPTDDGTASQIFVTNSYDATSHFETTCANIKSIYERITGEPFDFSQIKTEELQE